MQLKQMDESDESKIQKKFIILKEFFISLRKKYL